jgi:phenylacetate-CoA ligase
MARLPGWVRRRLYFSLQAAIGSKIGVVWREFLAWERQTPPQLQEQVDSRLIRLLDHATAHSEYYRNLKIERPSGGDALAWLRRFPVLSRVHVRDQFASLVVDNLRAAIPTPDSVSNRRYDWLVVKTGGSTGIPTTVVHDARTRDWGRATRLYAARQCGFPLGTPYFRLWGSELDLLKQQSSLQQRILRNLLAEVPMNAFKARESDLRQHLATMLSRPGIHHLMTYVDAAVSLAEFAEERGLKCPNLSTIMGCAGTLTPEFRRILTRRFNAEVFDKYGSRECCDMACECRHHTGLHVFSPNVYLEIVDDRNIAVPPGEDGRVLVTLLNNLSFPMIRYEIGDIGKWASARVCPCGSAFPLLESIQGRQDDMLTTEDGTKQSSAFVRHFVGVSLNRQLIREWQLEQTGATTFVFRYRPEKQEGLAENLGRLRESFQLVFGRSAEVEMRQVEEIPLSPSGKVRWIINSFRRG